MGWEERWSRRRRLTWTMLLALAFLSYSFLQRHRSEKTFREELTRSVVTPLEASPRYQVIGAVVPPRTNITELLLSHGIPGEAISGIVQSARSVDCDLSRIMAGRQLKLEKTLAGNLQRLEYEIDDDRYLVVTPDGHGFRSAVERYQQQVRVVGLMGQIEDSLFNAVTDLGEEDQLALELDEIFRWDLDFYTDPRRGDTFKVIVEKVYREGRFLRYGGVLAAEYVNDGRRHEAIRFAGPSGKVDYYDGQGKSVRKEVLRSPLKFGRVTSRFSRRRFHPILRHFRPHLGIDYAAPAGTPVQAVAAGRVLFAGWSGGSGRMVKIRHNQDLISHYLHLSRIRVRPGQRVEQGDVIGHVGSTGLATGAHLDFRIQSRNRFVNFLALKPPPAHPVPREQWEQFASARDRFRGELAALNRPSRDLLPAE
ncbi:MAG: M23 family metallopeptidase [Acidobacteria bacterium]|nr:M23 family metallopeptidase [Acidobacteriota bacterium]